MYLINKNLTVYIQKYSNTFTNFPLIKNSTTPTHSNENQKICKHVVVSWIRNVIKEACALIIYNKICARKKERRSVDFSELGLLGG